MKIVSNGVRLFTLEACIISFCLLAPSLSQGAAPATTTSAAPENLERPFLRGPDSLSLRCPSSQPNCQQCLAVGQEQEKVYDLIKGRLKNYSSLSVAARGAQGLIASSLFGQQSELTGSAANSASTGAAATGAQGKLAQEVATIARKYAKILKERCDSVDPKLAKTYEDYAELAQDLASQKNTTAANLSRAAGVNNAHTGDLTTLQTTQTAEMTNLDAARKASAMYGPGSYGSSGNEIVFKGPNGPVYVPAGPGSALKPFNGSLK